MDEPKEGIGYTIYLDDSADSVTAATGILSGVLFGLSQGISGIRPPFQDVREIYPDQIELTVGAWVVRLRVTGAHVKVKGGWPRG
jgi:hypothetical protein